MRYLASILIAAPLATGCFIDTSADNPDPGGPGPSACTTEPSYTIDTAATITHTAGTDPGYYAEYEGAGAWHFEWTCDTDLSAEGCTFTGSIIAPTPAGGDIGASCYECEDNDELSTQSDGNATEIDFNTVTTTGIDGVDFTTTAGAPVQINFFVNGIYQNDIVFIPSGGAAVNPDCMPAQLTPSTP